LLVKKFIFESAKNELETINLLINHFEKQKSNRCSPDDTQLARELDTLQPRPQLQGLEQADGLGYSREQFDKENNMVQLFLADITHNISPDLKKLKDLKDVIGKRLNFLRTVLAKYDFNREVNNAIDMKFNEDAGQDNKSPGEESPKMMLVGKNFGMEKYDEEGRVLNTEPRVSLTKKKKKKQMKKAKENADDSDLETESSEEEDQGIHYRKVLERKINLDRQKFKQLCFAFIRKEVKRMKNIIRMQIEKIETSVNPNMLSNVTFGFSDSLVNLIKKNKQDLPPDIKENLVKLLPETVLRDLGNQIFIDDEHNRLEREKELIKKVEEKKKRKLRRYKREEFGKDDEALARLTAEKEKQRLETQESQEEKPVVEELNEQVVRATLQKLQSGLLSDESKKRLLDSGIQLRDGKVVIKDQKGNEIDASPLINQTVEDDKRTKTVSPQEINKTATLSGQEESREHRDLPKLRVLIKQKTKELIANKYHLNPDLNNTGSPSSAEDNQTGNSKQHLQLRLSENYAIVEGDIITSKVRVLKPKKFKIVKNVVLPTLYYTGELVKPTVNIKTGNLS